MKKFWFAVAAALAFGISGTANALIVTSPNVPVQIQDSTTVTSTLNVTSNFTISDVNVLINNLTHTFDRDLFINISHGSTTVNLFNRQGGSGDNLISTIFDDEAAAAILSGSAPFSISYRPEQLLSAFDGQDAFGVWTLTVADLAPGDSGSINSWSIDITGQSQNVPEPASLVLVGLGIAGLAAARRRNIV